MNLARNIGGSIGISFVTTMLARRAQVHQVRLVENLNAGNPQFQSMLRGMTNVFSGGGAGPGSGGGSAVQHAYAMLQANVIRQATMLAYIDNFWLLGVVIACLIPCVFLIKKAKPGGPIVAH
jgi:MFS transporter, DHA2 family, multidrug resistance protein